MVYIASDTVSGEPAVVSDSDERTVSVPGLIAAGIWALGLVVGVVALATGHELVAGVALVLAVMSPWFGLAWVSRSQRGKDALSAGQIAPYAGGWPALHATMR